jgi:hypothetical protein
VSSCGNDLMHVNALARLTTKVLSLVPAKYTLMEFLDPELALMLLSGTHSLAGCWRLPAPPRPAALISRVCNKRHVDGLFHC